MISSSPHRSPGRRLFPLTVRRATAAVVAPLVAAALVSACGGGAKKASPDSTPGGGSADVNATCRLLTRKDVEVAIGAPVDEGEGTSGNACRFELSGGPDQAVLVLKTTDPANPGGFDRAAAERTDAHPLVGVGDKAFVTGNQAFVLRGQTIAIVVANLQRPEPALTEAVTKLAQVMAPRI